MRLSKKLTIPGTRSESHGERDNGKTFVITEMDAYAGQDWALRALLAMAGSGIPMPEGALSSGWEGLAPYGFAALLQAPYGALKPLLDDLLAQAKYEHKPGQPLQEIKPGPNCCVEEIATFLTLYKTVFGLHAGFS